MALVLARESDATLAIVRRVELDDVWPVVETMLETAIVRGHGEQTLSDVYRDLWNQDASLWLLYDGDGDVILTAVLQIVEYDALRACRIVLLAGHEHEKWMKFAHDAIDAWALDHGCARVETTCRPGFARRLKALGYDVPYIVATKDLSSLRH